ncbi:hypothetical protein HDU96_010378 [Phlyctochytrium bullatum]|nr:hypothetical protein HDU96_010378 [Phlyctochytrium bullatum]
MALVLLAPTAIDRGQGRARIPTHAFQRLKLIPNQWVSILRSDGHAHFARAWPDTSPAKHAIPTCTCDTLITSPITLSERDHLARNTPPAPAPEACVVRPFPIRPPPFTLVRVRVMRQEERGPGEASAKVVTPEEQVELEGCVVERVAVARQTKVVETIPESTEALVTSATAIEVTTDHRYLDADDDATPSPPPQDIRVPPGLEAAFDSLLETVMLPLVYAEAVEALRIDCPKGVLLYGPPGVGKTLVVTAVAKACNAHLVMMNGSDVFGSYTGESEARIKDKFSEAAGLARPVGGGGRGKPCILFIDEIDAVAPNRTDSSRHESRMVATLLTLMDGMVARGRLVVGLLNVVGSYLFAQLYAEATNGFVGADLSALCREAALTATLSALSSTPTTPATPPPLITSSAFHRALAKTTPSTIRSAPWVAVGGDLRGNASKFDPATPPSLKRHLDWEDVGGLEGVKRKLRQAVEWPMVYRETFGRLGLRPPRGILLYGPPGCSKTTLVKVRGGYIIAARSGATFLAINGAEIFSAYLGESERAVRLTFQRARASAPSVIFIDEVESMVAKRGMSAGSGGSGISGDPVQERILSTLLNEMDGIETAKDVLVVGATNRPDMVDSALLRPGRFDRIIYVEPPDADSRLKILSIHTRGMPLADDVDLRMIAYFRTDRFTGADLESVCREAALAALRESMGTGSVGMHHFDQALQTIIPSISHAMLQQYAKFEKEFGKGV